ncbi:hypothetical protein SAMN04487916_10392 [Arthrobacter sp. ov407]|nr:hypothetical protein SAMN04487916_10392 [Arthrobacter sp. ov407]
MLGLCAADVRTNMQAESRRLSAFGVLCLAILPVWLMVYHAPQMLISPEPPRVSDGTSPATSQSQPSKDNSDDN